MNWKPLSEPPRARHGWFAGARLPVNHAELDVDAINRWRDEFGFTKVWYNADATPQWWEPDAHGMRSRPIADMLTHWAELPAAPVLTEKPPTDTKYVRPDFRSYPGGH